MSVISTGVPALDAQIGGGYPCGRLTVIEGEQEWCRLFQRAPFDPESGINITTHLITKEPGPPASMLVTLAEISNLPIVALTYGQEVELTKEWKFAASLRLRIELGEIDHVRIVKNLMSASEERLIPLPVSYYCDDARHLVCVPYNVPNLHRMAEDLGIKRCWFHRGASYPHYDIPKRRIDEIKARCKVITSRELLMIVKGQVTR